MATTLYDIAVHRGDSNSRTSTLTVRAVPADLVGHLDPGTTELIRPDGEALREALPHNWRKAFDRAGRFWFPRSDDKNPLASLTLRDRRGQAIAYLYAKPYVPGFPELSRRNQEGQ